MLVTNRESSMESINYDYENNYCTYTDSDLESQPNSALRISNSTQYKINQRRKLDKIVDICLKSVTISIIIIIPIIICICEFYYAFSDASCVNIKNKNISVNLYIYLLVDGIYGILISIIVSLYIYFNNQIRRFELNSEIYKKSITYISYILLLFNLAWTIVGAIVFWIISSDYNCADNIYSFIFVEILIKLLFLFLIIIKIIH
jgi:hypothetical protein